MPWRTNRGNVPTKCLFHRYTQKTRTSIEDSAGIMNSDDLSEMSVTFLDLLPPEVEACPLSE